MSAVPSSRRARGAVLAAGPVAAALLVLLATGVVRAPDLEGALTDLSETLGGWTYALVAGLAFLETGACSHAGKGPDRRPDEPLGGRVRNGRV